MEIGFDTSATVKEPALALEVINNTLRDSLQIVASITNWIEDEVPVEGLPPAHVSVADKKRVWAFINGLERDLILCVRVVDAVTKTLQHGERKSPLRAHVDLNNSLALHQAICDVEAANAACAAAKTEEATDVAAAWSARTLTRMIQTPARTIADLKRKIETAKQEFGDEHRVLAHVLDDLDRIEQIALTQKAA